MLPDDLLVLQQFPINLWIDIYQPLFQRYFRFFIGICLELQASSRQSELCLRKVSKKMSSWQQWSDSTNCNKTCDSHELMNLLLLWKKLPETKTCHADGTCWTMTNCDKVTTCMQYWGIYKIEHGKNCNCHVEDEKVIIKGIPRLAQQLLNKSERIYSARASLHVSTRCGTWRGHGWP